MDLRSIPTMILKSAIPLGILALAIFGVSQMKPQTPTPKPPAENVPTLVEAVGVQAHQGTLDLPVNGVVVPHRERKLSAEVAGRVVNKAKEFRTGRFVKKGTVLATLFQQDYQNTVDQLKKQQEQAQDSIDELEVQIKNTEALIVLSREEVELQQKNLVRESRLRGTGAAAERELDEARRSELTARNALVKLQNDLRLQTTQKERLKTAKELIGIDLNQAELDLKRTEIKAPVSGVIVTDNIEEDSYLKKGDEITIIQDTSAIEVRCHLRVSELAWLWGASNEEVEISEGEMDRHAYRIPTNVNATVSYRLGRQTYQWTGKLDRYETAAVDEKSRTIPCRVLVKHPEIVQTLKSDSTASFRGPRTLMRGMFVRVTFHTPIQTQLLGIPEKAVQPGNIVYKIDNGKLKIIPVKRVRTFPGQVILDGNASALKAGDRVITSPLSVVKEDMAVEERAN